MLNADFVKIDKKQRIVEGYATTVSVDRDGQSMDEDFLQREFPKWADRYGNIRKMHRPEVVGKLIHRSDFDGHGYFITAKISDPQTWSAIERGELNGFSIGIKSPKLVQDSNAPKGKYVDGEIIETSVVDVPSNRDSDFVAVKTSTFDVANGSWLDNMDDMDTNAFCSTITDDDMDVYKRYYSDKERHDIPESDFAGPHRSFPIDTQEDVENSSRLIGHAKDPEAVKHRIIEIANRKGLKIPDSWKEDAQKDISLDSGLQGNNLEGQEDEKVSDNVKTTEVVEEIITEVADVSVETTEEVEKTVSAEEISDTTANRVETDAEKAATIAPSVTDQLFNALNAITAKLDALASQTDKDKDGDIDTEGELEAEAQGNGDAEKADDFDPEDFTKKFIASDEFANAIKSVIAQVLSEQSDTQKTLVADETKTLVADVEKRFGELNDSVSKFASRLETVEQMAAPPKGSVMAIEREVQKSTQADALEVVQKYAAQLPEDAQKDLFKHVYAQNINLNGGK